MRSSKASVWPAGTSSRVGNKKTKQLDLVKRFVLIVLMGKQTSEEEEDGTEMEEKLGEDVSLSREREL